MVCREIDVEVVRGVVQMGSWLCDVGVFEGRVVEGVIESVPILGFSIVDGYWSLAEEGL